MLHLQALYTMASQIIITRFDDRDFTGLPVQAKAIVLRYVATADYSNWDDDMNKARVLTAAISYRLLRNWFVFADYYIPAPPPPTPPSTVRYIRLRPDVPDEIETPARRLSFD